MYPEHPTPARASHTVQVHRPAPAQVQPAPVLPVQPGALPSVARVVLPDGRVVTGYAIDPHHPDPTPAKPAVSRTAVNVAVGGVGFLAVCGGLLVLTTFLTALTALITQLITLAAVLFGGFIAVQVLSAGSNRGGTTVNIRKAVIKRNHFRG